MPTTFRPDTGLKQVEISLCGCPSILGWVCRAGIGRQFHGREHVCIGLGPTEWSMPDNDGQALSTAALKAAPISSATEIR